jgi:hypothetical protein
MRKLDLGTLGSLWLTNAHASNVVHRCGRLLQTQGMRGDCGGIAGGNVETDKLKLTIEEEMPHQWRRRRHQDAQVRTLLPMRGLINTHTHTHFQQGLQRAAGPVTSKSCRGVY